MSVKETGETKVRTDSLNFDISLCTAYKLKNCNWRKKTLGLYFCGILDPATVQDCTKFLNLIKNMLLQLVRDIINGVCYYCDAVSQYGLIYWSLLNFCS